jgi:hypothetical protein
MTKQACGLFAAGGLCAGFHRRDIERFHVSSAPQDQAIPLHIVLLESS